MRKRIKLTPREERATARAQAEAALERVLTRLGRKSFRDLPPSEDAVNGDPKYFLRRPRSQR